MKTRYYLFLAGITLGTLLGIHHYSDSKVTTIRAPSSAIPSCKDDDDCEFHDECVFTDVKTETKICLKDWDRIEAKKKAEKVLLFKSRDLARLNRMARGER